MLPTEEETTRINEAQEAQPDIPLGTAEQFLQTLSTISCLESRLRLWSFKMEFEVIEKEVCEPLMDLKIGIASLQQNMTFKTILNVLLTFGNFLNSSACKGMFGILLANIVHTYIAVILVTHMAQCSNFIPKCDNTISFYTKHK